jgi:hypothetical protein
VALPRSDLKCFLAQRLALYSLLAGVATFQSGCANVPSIATPPPGAQAISVTVTPSRGSVMLGNQFLFTAAAKNSSDSAVSRSVNESRVVERKQGRLRVAVYTGAVPVELDATHAFLAVVSSGANPDKSVV